MPAPDYPGWHPQAVATVETIDPGPIATLASLFDDGLAAPSVGDPLPPLWHWVALSRWAASSELGPDGHPARGAFMPPIDLPRRMFAGGTVQFGAPLIVGDQIRRESIVESVTEKQGKSGPLVIVVVRTVLYGPDGSVSVDERQNIVYRNAAQADPATVPDAAEPAAMLPVERAISPASVGVWDFRTDPTLLMRFSAATSNAHRIHYDWPYATRIEGYPGLVVHGPLMTLALVQTYRLTGSLQPIASLRHRNLAPLFCGQPAQLRATATDAGTTVDLIGPGGAEAGPHTTIDLTFG
ncbi:FAS1-like dehydratase domain-containing protein [Jongsikchunia kroppenstedtii]|uniref:FAS1-like dehydratase domain-containing protein n=1 Tax=Jongsikchunia kroppenstedtii TaxID=1121721 RepID=UPI000375918E|nr:MaoC family dehydratase N-terminal domain-containing protein [Jongsikchunia kroppenstedtii]